MTKGMSFENFYVPADREHQQREKSKARDLRQSQWWRQQIGQGICYHCHGQFSKAELTMDHLVPISRGGKSTKKNVVVSCKSCNSQKQSWTTAELALHRLTPPSEI